MLGVLVLGAGLLQLAMGALRLGRWFRAISVAVVQGMLAGIGLVLIAGQVYALAGREGTGQRAGEAHRAARTRSRTCSVRRTALTARGRRRGNDRRAGGVAEVPKRAAKVLPAPLAAVALATAATVVFDLPVARVGCRVCWRPSSRPARSDFAALASFGVLGTVLAFTLIASAESLFSAAAVDRLHDGTRTDYDKELMAQGAGNAVCGALGALPMTAVIVRSSANVAGGRTHQGRRGCCTGCGCWCSWPRCPRRWG